MSRHGVLTVLAVLAALACGLYAHAQDAGGERGFFIESIAQESVVPEGMDGWGSAFTSDPNEYEVKLELPSGLALFRAFERREVRMQDLVFSTGISEESTMGATLDLGGRTSMSFSREDSAISDVFRQLQEAESTTTMALSQGFGGGSTSGQFTLSRSLHSEQAADESELRTLIQSMALDTGLWDGAHLTAGFTTRESQESAFRLQETGYNAELKMSLSGGEGLAHFDYLKRLVEGQSTHRRQIDLVAPFAVEGGTLIAEHHLKQTITDDREQTDRETSFVVPLDLIIDGARASYVEVVKIRDENRNEQSVLNFMTPMRLFGHDATFEHIQTETVKNEQVTDERVMRLSADFDGSRGMVERTEVVESTGEDLEHRARLRMQTPEIDLSRWASISANQVRDEVEGEETSRVSRVDLSVFPFDPLEVKAIYTHREKPGEQSRDDHNISTALALSDRAMLKGGIEQQQQRDGSPSIIRHLQLSQQAGSALDLRLGYTSFGAQYEDAGGDMLAQLSVGDPSEISLSAFYTEFDEKKKKPLDEPTTTLELRAGDPSELGFRAGYSSHAGREEPERSIGVAMEALGGALKLDYIRNPLDPSGKVVLLSDVYELGFKREIMGSVNMDLGYRYFIPRAGEALDSDQFFRLQLDGGNVNEGGQIALKYLSGHFVPYPKRGQPPASLLDLTYEKRWPGDSGRLTLSLSREEAPELSVGIDDNFEAEVKYETLF